jgi:hypothetical protein
LLRAFEMPAGGGLRRAARRLCLLGIGVAGGPLASRLRARHVVDLWAGQLVSFETFTRALNDGRLPARAQMALEQWTFARPVESLPGVARLTCHGRTIA